MFHTKDIIKINFTGIYMRVTAFPGGAAEFPIHLWQVRFQQEPVGGLNGTNVFKPQSSDQPVLVNAAVSFYPALSLGAAGGYYFNPRFAARLAKMAFGLKDAG
jgi:hypothetical protein